MDKIKNTLENNIAETLYITLYMKALESQKSDPILSDPMACEMLKTIDYDFSKYDKAIRSAIGVVVRSKHFDDQVRDFISRNVNPVVVILGCGLDTRYHRLKDCRNDADFYELDIPEVIALRRKFMSESSNDTYISASMFETDWMDMIHEKHPNQPIMFVIEGVLMYFEEEAVKKLFSDLSNRFSKAEIHFDVINKWLANNSHKHDTIKNSEASFEFGLDDDGLIENWGQNLSHRKTYLYSDFPGWKKVGFIQRFIMSVIPRYKYGGRLLHYVLN
ncbi:class I SAM-dependent methyltransferase [Marinifilum fragile]|uniref:class I SAM-dependent methyltransferase n=1 Tax=Marinifilum fragile TaxID=570161 RepID=UPI002AA7F3DB|nr:class I SAM-dependent methyltransferase [Marinifilum fragile]